MSPESSVSMVKTTSPAAFCPSMTPLLSIRVTGSPVSVSIKPVGPAPIKREKTVASLGAGPSAPKVDVSEIKSPAAIVVWPNDWPMPGTSGAASSGVLTPAVSSTMSVLSSASNSTKGKSSMISTWTTSVSVFPASSSPITGIFVMRSEPPCSSCWLGKGPSSSISIVAVPVSPAGRGPSKVKVRIMAGSVSPSTKPVIVVPSGLTSKTNSTSAPDSSKIGAPL